MLKKNPSRARTTTGRKDGTATSSEVVEIEIASTEDETTTMAMTMIMTGDGELDLRGEIGVYPVIAAQGARDTTMTSIVVDEMIGPPEIEIGIENAVATAKEKGTGTGNEVTGTGTMIGTVPDIHRLILRDIVTASGKEIEIVTATRGEGDTMIDRLFYRNTKAQWPVLIAMFNKVFITIHLEVDVYLEF